MTAGSRVSNPYLARGCKFAHKDSAASNNFHRHKDDLIIDIAGTLLPYDFGSGSCTHSVI
jgi:hypothetical protein